MENAIKRGLSFSVALALLIFSVLTLYPATAYAAGPDIGVYGYGGGGGGGGGQSTTNNNSNGPGPGGLGGAAGSSSYVGSSGGNGGKSSSINTTSGGGGAGGGAGPNLQGDDGGNGGFTSGSGGTAVGTGATNGGSGSYMNAGSGGNGANGQSASETLSNADIGEIYVIAGSGGNGGDGGLGGANMTNGGAGGNGGSGGSASLTLDAPLVTADSINVQSGANGSNGSKRGTDNTDGTGGTGGTGGAASLQVPYTLRTSSMNVTKPAGGGAIDVDIGTLDVSSNTTIAVSGTSAGEVVLGNVYVANRTALTLTTNGTQGQIIITNLYVEDGGTVTMPTDGSVVVQNRPQVSLSAPTGPAVALTTTNLVLAFNQSVAAVSGNVITITVDSVTYSCDASAAVISGTGTNCIATIPFGSFMDGGGAPLVLASNKTYSVGVSENAFRIAGYFTHGNIIGNTANAVGGFTTETTHTLSEWADDGAGNHTRYCTEAGCTYRETEEHSFGGSWASTGDTQHAKTCSVCAHEVYENHDWALQSSSSTPATCTEQSSEVYQCSVCEVEKTEHATEAREHDPGAWSSISDAEHKRSCSRCNYRETAAHSLRTAMSNGDLQHEQTCSVCEHKVYTDHVWALQSSTSATCTEQSTEIYTCGVCDATKTGHATAALGHTLGAWADTGTGTHKRSCTVAGCTYSKTESHTLSAWAYNGANPRTRSCTVAGCTYSETEGHTMGAWTNDGDGNHTRHCTIAGCEYSETKPHTVGDWVNNGEASTHIRRCTALGCDYSETETHVWGAWSENSAGHSRACSKCGYSVNAQHRWDGGTVEIPATATTSGLLVYRCYDCGATRQNVIQPWGSGIVVPVSPVIKPPQTGAVSLAGFAFIGAALSLGMLGKRRKK